LCAENKDQLKQQDTKQSHFGCTRLSGLHWHLIEKSYSFIISLSRLFPVRWKYPNSTGACGWCLEERASAVGVLSAQCTQSRDSLERPRSPLPHISKRTETAENSVLDASLLLLIEPPLLRECVLSFRLKFNPTSLGIAYERKGVAGKMRAACVSLCESDWQLHISQLYKRYHKPTGVPE